MQKISTLRMLAVAAVLIASLPGQAGAQAQAQLNVSGPDGLRVSISFGDAGLSIQASGLPIGINGGNDPFGITIPQLGGGGIAFGPAAPATDDTFNPLGNLQPRGDPQGNPTLDGKDDTGGNPGTGVAQPATGRRFQVKATAEGLIGGTTALGETIGKWSEGAALPSRSVLRRNVAVTYLANGRSSSCQVLDVGPWNTHDEYWNTPEGRPQAESGVDRRGRRTNRAGMDLYNATWYVLLGLNSYDKHLLENVSGQVEWGFAE
ncbi:MAG: hypothetical protein HY303_14150 [Candidatus Wallbacteria bacterium]|nr:hypothetical protein [Candidatus Wallbacteria bacterium]